MRISFQLAAWTQYPLWGPSTKINRDVMFNCQVLRFDTSTVDISDPWLSFPGCFLQNKTTMVTNDQYQKYPKQLSHDIHAVKISIKIISLVV